MTELDEILAANPGAESFRFGDYEALCNDVLALVRAGRKTVTCAALSEIEADREAMPVVGRRDVALEWSGAPALLIETAEVAILPMDEIDEAQVAAMGEFRDLTHFHEGYGRYFERRGGFDPTMKLVVERFRVIEDYSQGGAG